jgi:Flp pilus assembly protein TadG
MILSHAATPGRERSRSGAAAVELAALLPILVFLSMATVDYARVAYVQIVLQNCARNAALYEFYSKAGFTLPSGWTSLSAAASADAPSNLTVSASASTPGSSSNNTVTVTVTATFYPIALPSLHGLPSLPGSISLSQSATMPYPRGVSTTVP